MKNLISAFMLLVLITSCTKDFVENEDETHFEENKAQIKAYIAANNIDVTEDNRTGIFFAITDENPAASYPKADDKLHLSYTISSLSGNELLRVTAEDSSFFSYASAANIFEGFVIAVNSLREGEKGVFYIPSPLAFGENPPSNFVLAPWEVIVLEIENISTYTEPEFIDLYIENNGLVQPEITELGVRIFRQDPRPETEELVNGDVVTVKYKGYLLTKEIFDEGEFEFTLGSGNLIAGFEDGIEHMRVGEKATIIIPWQHAYGITGSSSIPAYATLAFDLEIVSKQ